MEHRFIEDGLTLRLGSEVIPLKEIIIDEAKSIDELNHYSYHVLSRGFLTIKGTRLREQNYLRQSLENSSIIETPIYLRECLITIDDKMVVKLINSNIIELKTSDSDDDEMVFAADYFIFGENTISQKISEIFRKNKELIESNKNQFFTDL